MKINVSKASILTFVHIFNDKAPFLDLKDLYTISASSLYAKSHRKPPFDLFKSANVPGFLYSIFIISLFLMLE